MKTILHILNTGSYSGAENVAITMINGIKERYPDKYRLVYVSLDGSIREVLKKNDIEFEAITGNTRKEIRRVVKKYEPAIIHAHDFTASVNSALHTNRIPIISHIHNNVPWIKTVNARSLIYAATCMKYIYVLGVSKAVFEEFVFGETFSDKEKVIGNPLDIHNIRNKAECAAQDANSFDIAFLGRLSDQKDPLTFLEIVRNIRDDCPDASAVMIGDGEMREEVETRIRELGLSDTVTLTGFLDNPCVYLKQANVMCMPSKWEGFGLAAVEALALGVPVVASPVGGLKDIITNDCGRLCKSNGEFSEEICHLLSDKNYQIQKSKGAKERAEQLDNIEEYIKQIDTLYSSNM